MTKGQKATFAALGLLAVLIVATMAAPAADEAVEVAPKNCQERCTFEFNPVCGYDGTCYTQYANKCSYDFEKCNKKNNLETVDMSLCDLANKNNHPNYKTCSE